MVVCGSRRFGTVLVFLFLLGVDAVPVVPETTSVNNSTNNTITARATFLFETANFLHTIQQQGLFAAVRTIASAYNSGLNSPNKTELQDSLFSFIQSARASKVVPGIVVAVGGAAATWVFSRRMFRMLNDKHAGSEVAPELAQDSPRLDKWEGHLKNQLPKEAEKITTGSHRNPKDKYCRTIAEDYILLTSSVPEDEKQRLDLLKEMYEHSGCQFPTEGETEGVTSPKHKKNSKPPEKPDLRMWRDQRVDKVYQNYRTTIRNFQKFSKLDTPFNRFLLTLQIVSGVSAAFLGVLGIFKSEKLSMIGLSILELLLFISMEIPLETDTSIVERPSHDSVTKVVEGLSNTDNCLSKTGPAINCEACNVAVNRYCGPRNTEWLRIQQNAKCDPQGATNNPLPNLDQRRGNETARENDAGPSTSVHKLEEEVTGPKSSLKGSIKSKFFGQKSSPIPEPRLILTTTLPPENEPPEHFNHPVDPHVLVAIKSLVAHCHVDQQVVGNRIHKVQLGVASVLVVLFAVYAALNFDSTGVGSSDVNVTKWTHIGLALALLSFLFVTGFIIAYFHVRDRSISRSEVAEIILKLTSALVEFLPLLSLWKASDSFNPSWVASKGHLWWFSLVIQICLVVLHAVPLVGFLFKLREKKHLDEALTSPFVGDIGSYVENALPHNTDDKNRLRILGDMTASAFGWSTEKGVAVNGWLAQFRVFELTSETKLPKGVWDFLSMCFVYKREASLHFGAPLAPTELPPVVAEFCKLTEWTIAKYFKNLPHSLPTQGENSQQVDKTPILMWSEFVRNDDKVKAARNGIRKLDAQLDTLYDSDCVLRRSSSSTEKTSTSKDTCSVEKLTHKFLLFAEDPTARRRVAMHIGIEVASLVGILAVVFGLVEISQS